MKAIVLLLKLILPKKLSKFIRKIHHEQKGIYNSRHYRGDNYLCPCCGKTFSSFMDYKYDQTQNKSRYIGYYKNKVCPNCFSLPRHRIICHYFSENRETLPINKILMFGAEYSITTWFDTHGFCYTTADLFERLADVKVDIQKIPYPDESWSLIICNNILEHVPDYKLALSELRRILEKNGILELTVPTDKSIEIVYEDASVVSKEKRTELFGQSDHLRIFGHDFEKLLIKSGFFVEVVDGNKLPAMIEATVGPANYDDNKVYICRRK
jgi:SAM-dependent methyltransferase